MGKLEHTQMQKEYTGPLLPNRVMYKIDTGSIAL